MTDTNPKFDPIPRLQQIAETIRERGAYTFDAPATAAYYIDCAIKEFERLHRDYSCVCNEMRRMMNERDESGEYKLPFLVVCDAFQSEMVAFADLVLPDTTYLERHDALSMLDRPISEFDGPCDSVRVPVVPPTGDTRAFQEVLVDLAARLKLPAFVTP